ncbi:hypothetical protein [Peribacillus sp. SCS-37]|uniref:hypothetical protein n=1 Tax=Paraperibacillus esterisolvens TaxID=3115296 RepID=UPI003906BFFD
MNKESLLLIQRFGNDEVKNNSWRILWIDKNGQVKEEAFDNEGRKKLPYRTTLLLAFMVTPENLGYKTDEAVGYPTIFYPLMFPFGSFLAGIVFIMFGWIRWLGTR